MVTLTRRVVKEQSPGTCVTTRPPLYNIHNNIPLPVLTPIIPFPVSDRCDTAVVQVHPQRKSSPAVIRFCPTLGWLHLVKIVSHRVVVHVTSASPIVFNVPDMWNRDEDNLLVQTISTKIRLNSYNPDWDVWWNRVAEEIPGHLPPQCRARYMSAAFLAQLTWVFLHISVGRVRCAPVCPSHDNRSKDSDTATIVYESPPSPAPSPSSPSSLTHVHRCIGYHNHNPQPLAESSVRLMYLRVYDSRDTSRQSAPSPSLCYSLTHVHSTLPTLTLFTITCTQVLRLLESLVGSTVSCCVTTRTRLTVCLPT